MRKRTSFVVGQASVAAVCVALLAAAVPAPTMDPGATVDVAVVGSDDKRAVIEDVPDADLIREVRGMHVEPEQDAFADTPTAEPGIFVRTPDVTEDQMLVGARGTVEATLADHDPWLDLSSGQPADEFTVDYLPVIAVGVADVEETYEARYSRNGGASGGIGGRPDLVYAQLPRAAAGERVKVETLIPSSESLPGAAFALRVTLDAPQDSDARWVEIGLDPSGVANASGGNYLERLTLVAFPDCVLTTPDVPTCLQGVPLVVDRTFSGLMRATVPADTGSRLGLSGQIGGMSAGMQVEIPTTSGDVIEQLADSRGLAFEGGGGGTVIAAIAGASGPSGTFKATDLSNLGSWSVSEQTGTFDYAVPLSTPPVTAGPTPDVTLSYSSAIVDGRSHARNGQAGLVGDGWSLGEAFIERVYLPCVQDFANGTDATSADHMDDLCWESPVTSSPGESSLVLSMDGVTDQLIWDGGNRYYPETNPDVRVTRHEHSGGLAVNGDTEGEYFLVQTADGSRHYFGYGRVPGGGETLTSRAATNSVGVVPVYADDVDEPNFDQVTLRGYRYMLDIEMDSVGNAATHSYYKDDNRYAVAGDAAQSTTYTRALRPHTTDYGYLLSDVNTVLASSEARVEYIYEDRCMEGTNYLNPLVGQEIECGPLTIASRHSFPDVPIDLMCTGTCASTNSSPTFFNSVRLSQVATYVSIQDEWEPVATHQLIQAFPPAAPESRTLWLDSVFTRGYANYDTSDYEDTYAIRFGGTEFPNRVDWSDDDFNKTKLNKRRITRVVTEFGGAIEIEYYGEHGGSGARHCPTAGATSVQYTDWIDGFDPEANTWDCYQVGAGSDAARYHKYLVSEVRLNDLVAGAPTQTSRYEYVGMPAWAYELNRLVPDGAPSRGWTDWRGYAVVKVSEVSQDGTTEYGSTENQYYRGMSRDYDGDDRSTEVSFERISDDESVEDLLVLRGALAASIIRDDEGAVASRSHDDYDVVGATTGVVGAQVLSDAKFVRVTSSTSTQYEPGTYWERSQTTATSYTPENLVAQTTTTTQSGAEVVTECTAYGYVWNVSDASGDGNDYFNAVTWGGVDYLYRSASVQTFEGGCGSGILTSSMQTYFDGATSLTANIPTRGLITEQRVSTGPTDSLTSRWTHDDRGREVTSQGASDIENAKHVATSYSTGLDGLREVAVTNQLGHVSRSWIEPGHANVVREQSMNGDWTHYEYDAQGLFSAGWSPREHGVQSPPGAGVVPTVSVEYDLYAPTHATRRTPAAVMTAQHTGVDGSGDYICADEACFVRRSYTFLDGFGRTRQQHSVQPNGGAGRVIIDTEYDDRGLVARTSAPFANSLPAQFGHVTNGDWTSALFIPDYDSVVSYSETQYDWAGRPVLSTLNSLGSPVRGTSFTYLGKSTQVEGPSGGITETVADVRGRLVAQYQHPETGYNRVESLHTTYAYATLATGARTTVTDPDGFDTVNEVDLAGRRLSLNDANAGTTTYMYGAGGQVASVTSETGTISFSYDVLGRTTARTSTDPDGAVSSSATWQYDPSGHAGALAAENATTVLASGEALTVTTAYTYDSLHRPASSTVQLPVHTFLGDLSGQSYVKSVGYDAIGQPTSATLPSIGGLPTETVTTDYDVFGTAIKLAAGPETLVASVGLDPVGRVVTRELGNGVNRDLSWSPVDGSLVSAEASYKDRSDTVHVQFDVYDREVASGRVTGIRDLVTRDAGTVSDASDDYRVGTCFEYDGYDRLAAAWTVDTLASGCASAPMGTDEFWNIGDEGFAQAWSYTDAGRIASSRTWLAPEGVIDVDEALYGYDDSTSPHAVTSIDHNANLDEFVYDDAGRTVSRDVGAVDSTLEWDVVSNLVGVTNANDDVQFIYDASGQRVARISDAVTVYFGETEVVDPDAAVAGSALEGVRYYALGSTVVAYRDDVGLSYMFADVQGSATVSMTAGDPAVAVVTRNAYMPYGQLRAGEIGVERGWLGQVADADTGLMYLNARYYDAMAGRFLSPDPLWDPGEPVTLDPYRYADNNPVSYMDPTGLRTWCGATAACKPYNTAPKPKDVLSGKFRPAKATKSAEHQGLAPRKTTHSAAPISICGTGFACGSARDEFYGSAVGAGFGGLENWIRGFADSVLGLVDLPVTSVASGLSGGVFTPQGRAHWTTNGSGGFTLDRIGPSGFKHAEASYWTGAIINPTILIGSGAGGASSATTLAPQVIRAGAVKLPAVPKGAVGTPATNGKGLQYVVPRGTPELHPSVVSIRVMDPVTSGKFQYPKGYVSYMNADRQVVSPLSGQTLQPSDPLWHIPLP